MSMHFPEVMIDCMWHDENEFYPKGQAHSSSSIKGHIPKTMHGNFRYGFDWSIFIIVAKQISELVLITDRKKPQTQQTRQQPPAVHWHIKQNVLKATIDYLIVLLFRWLCLSNEEQMLYIFTWISWNDDVIYCVISNGLEGHQKLLEISS